MHPLFVTVECNPSITAQLSAKRLEGRQAPQSTRLLASVRCTAAAAVHVGVLLLARSCGGRGRSMEAETPGSGLRRSARTHSSTAPPVCWHVHHAGRGASGRASPLQPPHPSPAASFLTCFTLLQRYQLMVLRCWFRRRPGGTGSRRVPAHLPRERWAAGGGLLLTGPEWQQLRGMKAIIQCGANNGGGTTSSWRDLVSMLGGAACMRLSRRPRWQLSSLDGDGALPDAPAEERKCEPAGDGS